MFAPDPRQTSLRIEGRVTFEDGSTAVWELPEGPRIGANFRYYRWRKWLERVRSDDFRNLWEPDGPMDRAASTTTATRQWPRSSSSACFHENVLVGAQPPYEEFTYCTYVPAEGDGCQ